MPLPPELLDQLRRVWQPCAAANDGLLAQAIARLDDGPALARAAASRLGERNARSFLLGSPNVGDLDRGVGDRTPWPRLVAWLRATWPNGVLHVACPMLRPDDPGVADDPMLVVDGESVLATVPLDAEPADVERTLRIHDPAFRYTAMVLDDPAVADAPAAPSPTAAASATPASIVGAVVGVHDGEAFICCTLATSPSVPATHDPAHA